MNKQLKNIISELKYDNDKIFSSSFENLDQSEEINLREKNAKKRQSMNFHDFIPKHHSIPVMRNEVRRALSMVEPNSIILDVGGGIGWHWYQLGTFRPDISVIILDFSLGNLARAKNLHKEIINSQIFLVHGDATQLPFPENSFDLYWSVQALQHIPNFNKAVHEAKRVLKPEGVFMNYSVNRVGLFEIVYKIFKKKYHIKGKVPGFIYLERGSNNQRKKIERIFKEKVKSRFTEVLYHPQLNLWTGNEGNYIGVIDASLGSSLPILKFIANQRSFEVKKRLN
tara:strand:+ start:1389 stop:2237 length:849 start_codon:yes stop_codon:yes gene_type:complete